METNKYPHMKANENIQLHSMEFTNIYAVNLKICVGIFSWYRQYEQLSTGTNTPHTIQERACSQTVSTQHATNY